MSILSQALHHLADLFKTNVGTVDPTAQASLTTAADHVHAAADQVAIAVPIIAEEAANAALARLGPVGVLFAPAVDSFIEATVASLLRRHSAQPVIAPAATAQPGAG